MDESTSEASAGWMPLDARWGGSYGSGNSGSPTSENFSDGDEFSGLTSTVTLSDEYTAEDFKRDTVLLMPSYLGSRPRRS